jgi:hypothetical protein
VPFRKRAPARSSLSELLQSQIDAVRTNTLTPEIHKGTDFDQLYSQLATALP